MHVLLTHNTSKNTGAQGADMVDSPQLSCRFGSVGPVAAAWIGPAAATCVSPAHYAPAGALGEGMGRNWFGLDRPRLDRRRHLRTTRLRVRPGKKVGRNWF